MFGSLNGQLAAGVEVDDLGHAVKRAAVLAQDVLVFLRPRQLHVHEALAAPEDTRTHSVFTAIQQIKETVLSSDYVPKEQELAATLITLT